MKISDVESVLDLDTLYDLSSNIEQVSLSLEGAKQQLTDLVAKITRTVTKDEVYWVAGKPPSVSFIKEQYHILGYDQTTYEELTKLRNDIYLMEIAKSKFEREFNLALKLLDVWRTYSANNRRTLAGLEPA